MDKDEKDAAYIPPYEAGYDHQSDRHAPLSSFDSEDEDHAGSSVDAKPQKKEYLDALKPEEIEMHMNDGLLDKERESEPSDKETEPSVHSVEDEGDIRPVTDSDGEVETGLYDEDYIRKDSLAARSEHTIPETWSPSAAEPARIPAMEPMELEEGKSRDGEDVDCSWAGPLEYPFERCAKCFTRRNISRSRAILIVAAVAILLIGIILFLSLFPASWVYLHYDKIALVQNQLTNVVDRDRTFYPGAYVQGPEAEFLEFDATVHNVALDLEITTVDELSLNIKVNVQYFLKGPELGLLYSTYGFDYKNPVRLLIEASIKNLAVEYSLDEYRLKRKELENTFRLTVKKRLGGDCCPSCCIRKKCADDICDWCKAEGNCTIGRHINVRFFSLLSIDIPDEITERYMAKLILGINFEKELHLQEHSIVKKKTSREVLKIENAAAAVRANGTANAKTITTVAEINKEIHVQKSYVSALSKMFKQLNVTQEPHKASLMLIRALEDMDNLYYMYNYEKETLLNPFGFNSIG